MSKKSSLAFVWPFAIVGLVLVAIETKDTMPLYDLITKPLWSTFLPLLAILVVSLIVFVLPILITKVRGKIKHTVVSMLTTVGILGGIHFMLAYFRLSELICTPTGVCGRFKDIVPLIISWMFFIATGIFVLLYLLSLFAHKIPRFVFYVLYALVFLGISIAVISG